MASCCLLLISLGASDAVARVSSTCRATKCHATVSVSAAPARFSSEETFSSSKEVVSVKLIAAGKALKRTFRTGWNGCRSQFEGPGIRAVANTCGDDVPVRVAAWRSWGGTVVLEIVYGAEQIQQGVKGIEAGSAGSGVGATSGPGGISPRRAASPR